MRLRKPQFSIKNNSLPRTARNRLTINHLEAISFSRFQYGLESGSGPGGRRFKSSLPDHLFSATYADLKVLKNPAVGKNVTLFTSPNSLSGKFLLLCLCFPRTLSGTIPADIRLLFATYKDRNPKQEWFRSLVIKQEFSC